MGFRRLAIVDLPQAIVAQYIVLSQAFGADNVRLNEDIDDGIRLLTVDHILAQSFDRAQVLINVDSFPEMPSTAASGYIDRLPTDAILLSINQESALRSGQGQQNVVAQIAALTGLRRVSRYPSWLRTGWVEEVFVHP